MSVLLLKLIQRETFDIMSTGKAVLILLLAHVIIVKRNDKENRGSPIDNAVDKGRTKTRL